MGHSGMMSYEATEPLDVVIRLDTEANTATLDTNVGMFDVGDRQVLAMMVSEQLREVWDIDRVTGRAMVSHICPPNRALSSFAATRSARCPKRCRSHALRRERATAFIPCFAIAKN
jgi:hypothetical protein